MTQLRVAAVQFETMSEADSESDSRTKAKVVDVVGPLKTTVLLLQDGDVRVCMVTTHFGWTTPVNVCQRFRQAVADELQLPISHVLIFSSHNHCCAAFASNAVQAYTVFGQDVPEAELLPIGQQFLDSLVAHVQQLPDRLEHVTVWWAEGCEDRITYNRKGVSADGSSYLMREQDRIKLGVDFNGDIDTQAPIITFRTSAGDTIAGLTQFTGHPVTSYHPERPIVFGEWPQVACDMVEEHLDQAGSIPVGFLQGCAGDVNSKEMLSGNVKRSTEFGRLLGQSWVDVWKDSVPSERSGLDFAVETVALPLAPLPDEASLRRELQEMDHFIQRARSGDEDTLSCVGQNFATALSPGFRADLVEILRRWNLWALQQYADGTSGAVARELQMEISVMRIGDVGIVGLPCEPFQEIGRQIRRQSPLPISIPCGYTNFSHGYITDSGNIGGQEYMSSHYRYTRFRPPIGVPAGDVLSQRAVEILRRFR